MKRHGISRREALALAGGAAMAALPGQIAHAQEKSPYYRRLLAEVDPQEVNSRAALAQLHWQIARRFRVQIGGGVEVEDGKVGAAVVTRWILE